ncbi:MAG: hypothetical protein A4E19_20030 [Nitrospira sp. SG-bin1]|nr:MAG: hypothetical protein A4E19_20030 [Nitrospira sp. SG-bin1]
MTTLLHRVMLPLVSLGLVAVCHTDAWSDQSDTTKGQHPLRQQSMNEALNLGGDRQSSKYTDHKASWKQVSGEIERVKKVAVRGKGEEHLAVLLNTEQGRRVVADLGQAKQFRGVELRAGDWIAARGPVGRVNDRRVLFAREINVDGEVIRIDRGMPAQHSRRSPKAVSGKIAIIKELKVKDGDQPHQVVRILMKDGKQVVADLGKKAALKGINLEYGQEISVEGPMARLSGKPFVLAQKVTTKGETARIEREFLSAMPPGREGEEAAAAENRSREVSGEVLVKGEVLNIDRDGFYIVRDPSGKEVHLLIAEDLNQGLQVGDRIQAQVRPDGSVTSISKASETQSQSPKQ